MCPKPRSTSCWAGVGSSLYRRPTLALALPPPPVFLFAIASILPVGCDSSPYWEVIRTAAPCERRYTTALKDGALRRDLGSRPTRNAILHTAPDACGNTFWTAASCACGLIPRDSLGRIRLREETVVLCMEPSVVDAVWQRGCDGTPTALSPIASARLPSSVRW